MPSQFIQRAQAMPTSPSGGDFTYFDHKLCPVKFVLAAAPNAVDNFCQIVPSFFYRDDKGLQVNSRVVMQVSLILKQGEKSIVTPSQPIFFPFSIGKSVSDIIDSSGDEFSDAVALGQTVFEVKKEASGDYFKYDVQRLPKPYKEGVAPSGDNLLELAYAYMVMNRKGTNAVLLKSNQEALPRISQMDVASDVFMSGFFAYVQEKAPDALPSFFEGIESAHDDGDIPF